MEGLSSKYINSLMKICTLDYKNFIGVLSCDVFLNMTKNGKINLSPGQGIILNLSSSNHPGSHWVAVFVNTNGVGEFFDSFGLQCFDSKILEAFQLHNLRIINFEKTLQHPDSHFCGFYCVAYLLCREVGISRDMFTTFFHHKDLLKNDHTCIEIIQNFVRIREI